MLVELSGSKEVKMIEGFEKAIRPPPRPANAAAIANAYNFEPITFTLSAAAARSLLRIAISRRPAAERRRLDATIAARVKQASEKIAYGRGSNRVERLTPNSFGDGKRIPPGPPDMLTGLNIR